MSARVIPFPGQPPYVETVGKEQEAIHHARLIRQGQDGGASMALALAMLSVMPRASLLRVQSELEAAPVNIATEEALALVRYATASNAHKRMVAIILQHMGRAYGFPRS